MTAFYGKTLLQVSFCSKNYFPFLIFLVRKVFIIKLGLIFFLSLFSRLYHKFSPDKFLKEKPQKARSTYNSVFSQKWRSNFNQREDHLLASVINCLEIYYWKIVTVFLYIFITLFFYLLFAWYLLYCFGNERVKKSQGWSFGAFTK